MSALAATSSSIKRVWDSGAINGMTRPGSTDGEVQTERMARVFTGAGVVKTSQWVIDNLSWGRVKHVGVKETMNTLSAGQLNSELGVETSWLAPKQPSENSPCGPCITHKADRGHVTWSGTHKVQLAASRDCWQKC